MFPIIAIGRELDLGGVGAACGPDLLLSRAGHTQSHLASPDASRCLSRYCTTPCTTPTADTVHATNIRGGYTLSQNSWVITNI